VGVLSGVRVLKIDTVKIDPPYRIPATSLEEPLCAYALIGQDLGLSVSLGSEHGATDPVGLRVSEVGVEGATPLAEVFVTPGEAVRFDLKLAGADMVGRHDHVLAWDVLKGGGWSSLESLPIRIYRILDTPKVGQIQLDALDKATSYARGAGSAQAAAAALRSGIRGRDRIGYAPNAKAPSSVLDLYKRGVGNCSHISDLLVLLARTIGIPAEHVVIRGGFVSAGEYIAVMLELLEAAGQRAPSAPPESRGGSAQAGVDASNAGGIGVSLLDVAAGRPEYAPPVAPTAKPGMGNQSELSREQRWAFSVHVVVDMAGALHDAALDVKGFSGRAYLAGFRVTGIEATTADFGEMSLGRGQTWRIPRVQHKVAVTQTHVSTEGQLTAFDTDPNATITPPVQAEQPYVMPVDTLVTDSDDQTEFGRHRGDRLPHSAASFASRFTANLAYNDAIGKEFTVAFLRK